MTDDGGNQAGLTTGTAINAAGPTPVSLYWTLHASGSSTGRVLLISGLGSPLVSYEDGFVGELVARGFDVARFDNRDVGRSTLFEGTEAAYTISDMAADAVAVLDALGWADAVIVGQSMGGMIAQQLAIDAPERVSHLVSLMSMSGEPGYGTPTAEAWEALSAPPPQDPDQWLEHRVVTEKLWASPELWDEEWVRAKGRALVDHGVSSLGTARQFRAIQASGSRDQGLAGLSTPTLVLHGSADTLIQPDGGRHVADIVPAARYVEIEGMGHDLPPALWPRLADEITGHARA